ncbi:MAG: hypothetical protein GY930_22390 [bacterium]|nr:hypothetical protein [bacterium]
MKISHQIVLGFVLAPLFACSNCGAPALDVADEPSVPPTVMQAVQLGGMDKLHKFGDVYLGGQPSEADLALLKERGVVSVINMRKAGEMSFDQEATLKGLGLASFHLGWNGPDELTDALFDSYRELMNDSPQPMLLHCASGNRVGAIWIAWRVLDQGASVDTAVAEAKMAGMRTPDYEAKACDYVDRMVKN